MKSYSYADILDMQEAQEQNGLNGFYYFFDCLDGELGGILWDVKKFDDDNDAIEVAADHEAILYKHEYKNGVKVESKKLYDPFNY